MPSLFPSLKGLLRDPDSRWNFPQIEARRYRKALYWAYKQIEESGQLVLGPGLAAFEQAFATWLNPSIDPRQVIGVANGTDAIELALHACGVGKGDLVALPSHTAYATTAAILRLGAHPLFIDISLHSHTLCPSALSKAVTSASQAVKAVIAVHLYGESCDLTAIQSICKRLSIPLVEDCAQACGTTYEGRTVGTWGDYACFSFYPTKNLAALGDGGALVVNSNLEKAGYCRRSRAYGWNEYRDAVQWGVNSRLDELQALLLTQKLKDLRKRILQRRQIAGWYSEKLSPLLGSSDLISLPGDGKNWKHSYHLYVIQVAQDKRDHILSKARSEGIPLAIHYSKPCHHQPYLNLDKLTCLPRTEEVTKTILSLPLHPYLRKGDIADVSDFLKSRL